MIPHKDIRPPRNFFNHFSAANVYYKPFGEILEDSSCRFQISCTVGSIIAIYIGKYDKILEDPKDKSMINIDENDTQSDIDNKVVNSSNEDREDKWDSIKVK